MSDLVAQGYDGAAFMSSDKNGVQAKVKNIPCTLYQVDVIMFHLPETYLKLFKSSHCFLVAVPEGKKFL